MTDLRCYTFTIFQLSSIQQGIQAGHAVVELFNKYQKPGADTRHLTTVCDWARDHKTMVCLNAGEYLSLQKILSHLCDKENPYPWAHFKESLDFLAGIMTSVAIILPQEFYETAAWVRANPTFESEQALSTQHYRYDPVRQLHLFSYHLSAVDILGNEDALEFTEWQLELMRIMNRAGLAR